MLLNFEHILPFIIVTAHQFKLTYCFLNRSMTSQALIPYSHCQSTNALNVDVRVFDLNGLLIKINQNWKADGRGGTKIGFGASIYDCSYILLDYLQNNVEIIRGKSVLEFGCGTGFVSIAVSMLGIRKILSDEHNCCYSLITS
jgi:hypothetical protein